MKYLPLILTLFSSLLFSKIPSHIEQKLCQQLAQDGSAYNRCENGSRLEYMTHFITAKDKILVFLYLNEQTDAPHVSPTTQVPVLIDRQGHWSLVKGKNEIQEWIQSISEDPYYALWLRALWVVEGASSALYYSRDGSSIQEIILPKSQELNGYYQGMQEPCFQKNHIVLNFDAFYNHPSESWKATYKSAVSKHPKWVKQRSQAEKNCRHPYKKTNWKQIDDPNEMVFLHSKTHQAIRIPKTSKKHDNFYIQIGAYKNKKYAHAIERGLESMPYPTRITEATVRGNRYYRLRIGAFTSLSKAQFVLRKMPWRHRDAFIVRLKNK